MLSVLPSSRSLLQSSRYTYCKCKYHFDHTFKHCQHQTTSPNICDADSNAFIQFQNPVQRCDQRKSILYGQTVRRCSLGLERYEEICGHFVDSWAQCCIAFVKYATQINSSIFKACATKSCINKFSLHLSRLRVQYSVIKNCQIFCQYAKILEYKQRKGSYGNTLWKC